MAKRNEKAPFRLTVPRRRLRSGSVDVSLRRSPTRKDNAVFPLIDLQKLCLFPFASKSTAAPKARKEPDALIHRTLTNGDIVAEQVQLPNEPALTVLVFYKKGNKKPMPIMLGWGGDWTQEIEAAAKDLPRVTKRPVRCDKIRVPHELLANLIDRGCIVACFTPREIPWLPDKPRWIWPHPDQAGAEFFTKWCEIAPWDFGLVIDYMQTRKDVRPDRIGYMGFSAAAIIGVTLVAKERRITCAVLYGGSGSFKTFWQGWRKCGIWENGKQDIWRETKEKLKTEDPVLFAKDIFPCALLMVNGGKDHIIPIESNKHFFDALWPHYAPDPDRLQYVVFEGAGHGWDAKWWDYMALDWLDRYLVSETPPPARPRT